MSYVLILITIFLFSTLEVTGKLIGPDISPSAVTIYRFLIGGLFLLPFAIKRMQKRHLTIGYKDLLKMSIPGVINVTISMLCLQYAIYYGKASVTAVLISSNPLFAAFFARIFLKQKLSLKKFIGMLIGLAGVVIIIGTDDGSGGDVINGKLGVLFGIIATITFGLYTALAMKYVEHYGSTVLNTFAFLIGSAILYIFTLLFNGSVTFSLTKENLYFMGYLGVFVTGIAYLCYFQGLKELPASVGSMFFFLKPVIASILAFMIFKESLDTWQYIGFFIVLIGMNLDKISPGYGKNLAKRLIRTM